MDRINPNPDAVDPEFPQLADTTPDEELAADPDNADDDDAAFEEDDDEEADEADESEAEGSE
jgi:hypothetical protein